MEIIRDIPQEYLKSLAMIVSVTASENISSHVPRAEILSLFSRFFGDQEKIEAAQLMFSPNSAEQPYLDGGDLGALQGIELFELPPELKTIEELDFSQRTYNILTHAEISTLGELENYSFQSLMEIPKMGKKSLEEIMAKLQEYRIIFKKSL